MSDMTDDEDDATKKTGPGGEAAERFAALTDEQRRRLLDGVFSILESDLEWGPDTTAALGELFDTFGITFPSSEG